MIAIVSEECWLGDDVNVCLVRSKKDGLLYSYCWSCGACNRPTKSDWKKLGKPNSGIIDPSTHFPEGFELPSKPDIEAAGLANSVIRFTDDEYFCQKYFERELVSHWK